MDENSQTTNRRRLLNHVGLFMDLAMAAMFVAAVISRRNGWLSDHQLTLVSVAYLASCAAHLALLFGLWAVRRERA